MANLRPGQLETSDGTTDNDSVTTKGYVDEHEGNAIWTLTTTEVELTTSTNTIKPAVPLKYTTHPTFTTDTQMVDKKYVDDVAPLHAVSGFIARTTGSSPSQDNVTGTGELYQVKFDQIVTNVGGHYNNVTNQFTFPVTGEYFITYILALAGVTGGHNFYRVLVNNSIDPPVSAWKSLSSLVVAGDKFTDSGSVKVKGTASTVCEILITVDGNPKSIDIEEGSYFTATLIQKL